MTHSHKRLMEQGYVKSIILSCFAGALFTAVVERILLPSFVSESAGFLQGGIILTFLIFGNLLIPGAVLCVVLIVLFSLFHALSGRTRHAGRTTGIVVAVLSIPYAAWLSLFTYSGPRVRDLQVYPLLVAVTAALIFLSFAFYILFFLLRYRSDRFNIPVGTALLFLSVVSVTLSMYVYPNEYKPLHAFLGIWSLLLAVSGANELIKIARMSRKNLRNLILTAVLVWLVSITSTAAALSGTELYASIIWNETPVSRYITRRLVKRTIIRKIAQSDTDALKKLAKPQLETPQTLALRKKRLEEEPPNIVLLYLDNVQADHVGAYGYRRNPTTPNIDEFARKGILFKRAYSSFPQTRNFMSMILLGRFVPYFNRHNPPESYVKMAMTRLLNKRGYQIFVHGIFELSNKWEFNYKNYLFDQYVGPLQKGDPRKKQKLGAWGRVENHMSMLEEHLTRARKTSSPVFVWMHLLRPHWLHGSNSFRRDKNYDFGMDLADKYDSAIASSDAWIKVLKDMMNKLMPSKKTVWIFGSDHGAGMGRFDRAGGKTLYNVHTKVPLIISAPGIGPKTVETPVDAPLDVSATILDFAGIDPPESYDGISLIPLMMTDRERDRAVVLNHKYKDMSTGVVLKNWKLIIEEDSLALYNLAEDPDEKQNIADRHPETVEELFRIIEAVLPSRVKSYKNGG